MPRLLALGHVTRDELAAGERPGGGVSYAALAARRLGWCAGIVTSAAADFDPARDLPGVEAFHAASGRSTRFRNLYAAGVRTQHLLARADPVDASLAPGEWRNPDVLLLAPVAGELGPGTALTFQAGVVGACAQGWLRQVAPDTGAVSPAAWADPESDLAGVDVVFVSEADFGGETWRAQELLSQVPMVLLTRGRRGADLLTRDGTRAIPTRPVDEVDATGAGDVFATAFMIAYHETRDPVAATVFGCCAAACVVEAPGTTGLGDRDQVERRRVQRERWLAEHERERE